MTRSATPCKDLKWKEVGGKTFTKECEVNQDILTKSENRINACEQMRKEIVNTMKKCKIRGEKEVCHLLQVPS